MSGQEAGEYLDGMFKGWLETFDRALADGVCDGLGLGAEPDLGDIRAALGLERHGWRTSANEGVTEAVAKLIRTGEGYPGWSLQMMNLESRFVALADYLRQIDPDTLDSEERRALLTLYRELLKLLEAQGDGGDVSRLRPRRR